MNGQEAAEENLRRFEAWASGKSDADFRALARGGKLSRSEILKECGFARSVLAQNPRVKARLAEIEAQLRGRGILAAAVQAPSGDDGVDEPGPLRQLGQADGATVHARLKSLEQRAQALTAENAELRSRLVRYAHIEEVLTATGRMPR